MNFLIWILVFLLTVLLSPFHIVNIHLVERIVYYLFGEWYKKIWYNKIWWLHNYWSLLWSWIYIWKIKWHKSNMWPYIPKKISTNYINIDSLMKKITDRYNLNTLRIIAIIYHIYIKCKLYNLVYRNIPRWIY